MILENVYDRYKTDVINTATPDQLVLMLFEAALRSAQECQDALAREDWIAAVDHGRMVQDVMANLAETVIVEHPDGDRMKGLYLFCWRAAIAAQIEHDGSRLDAVKDVLHDLVAGLRGFLSQRRAPAVTPDASTGTKPEHISIDFSG